MPVPEFIRDCIGALIRGQIIVYDHHLPYPNSGIVDTVSICSIYRNLHPLQAHPSGTPVAATREDRKVSTDEKRMVGHDARKSLKVR